MRTRRATMVLMGVLVAAFALAGCSSDDAAEEAAPPARPVTSGDAAGQDAGGNVEAPAAEQGARAAGGDADAVLQAGTATTGRDIIRTAEVRLASDDPDATVSAIGRAAVAAGGFVASTDLDRRDGVLQGTVTIRVPADAFETALADVEAAGAEVVSRRLDTRDVTGEVADLDSQLRNLRAAETELLALLVDARETGDTGQVLTVFNEVRSIRAEIERLEGRRATLADLVALATVTVTVEPSEALLAASDPAEQSDAWSPRERLQDAWEGTLAGLRTFVDVLIVLAVTVLPVAALWAVPLVIAGLAARALLRHRRAGHGAVAAGLRGGVLADRGVGGGSEREAAGSVPSGRDEPGD